MPCWSKHCGAEGWKQKKQHPWDTYYWTYTSCKQYLLTFFTPQKSIHIHLISEDYNTLFCILRHYSSNRSIPASWHTQSCFTGERLSTQYCMSDYQSTSRASKHLLEVAGRFSKQPTASLSSVPPLSHLLFALLSSHLIKTVSHRSHHRKAATFLCSISHHSSHIPHRGKKKNKPTGK